MRFLGSYHAALYEGEDGRKVFFNATCGGDLREVLRMIKEAIEDTETDKREVDMETLLETEAGADE